jgi:oligopeptide transport system ATP-binding protein
MSSKPFLQVKELKKHYVSRNQLLKAVDGVSFEMQEGETLGLVGESGCGKSTLGRILLRLEEATSGQILFEGEELNSFSDQKLMLWRRQAQIIFQDPYASLNPRMTAGDLIAEPLDIHKVAKGRERQLRVEELFNLVGLNPAWLNRFPHEFSGGQRQRIGIARALALNPRFIVCDEPISSLDVTIQAQIVNLLKRLQQEKKLTYLFIAHDLNMVKYISDRVVVMYLGHVVEVASSQELYENPLHPYTQALLAAIPIADPKVERSRSRIVLKGEVPSPLHPPSGCVFASRCPHATEQCHRERPAIKELAPGHFGACHLY